MADYLVSDLLAHSISNSDALLADWIPVLRKSFSHRLYEVGSQIQTRVLEFWFQDARPTFLCDGKP
jgi:hypothetical protein